MHISWAPSTSQRLLDTSAQATEFGCLALSYPLPFYSSLSENYLCGISPRQEWVHPLDTRSPSLSEHLLPLSCAAQCVRSGASWKSSMGLQNVAQKANLSSSLNIFFLSNRASLGFNK